MREGNLAPQIAHWTLHILGGLETAGTSKQEASWPCPITAHAAAPPPPKRLSGASPLRHPAPGFGKLPLVHIDTYYDPSVGPQTMFSR